MSNDPVITWIENFLERLDEFSVDGGANLDTQRKTILMMINNGTEEVERLTDDVDAADDIPLLSILIELLAQSSASLAMFKQALIVFDRKHKKRPNILGDWKRGGTDGEGNN